MPDTLWTRISFLRGAPVPGGTPTVAAFTTGLAAFIGREIEFQPAPLQPVEVAQRLVGLCQYLIVNGPVIRDGETVGLSEREKIRVRHAPAGQRPGVPVLLMSLEVADPAVSGPQTARPCGPGSSGGGDSGRARRSPSASGGFDDGVGESRRLTKAAIPRECGRRTRGRSLMLSGVGRAFFDGVVWPLKEGRPLEHPERMPTIGFIPKPRKRFYAVMRMFDQLGRYRGTEGLHRGMGTRRPTSSTPSDWLRRGPAKRCR